MKDFLSTCLAWDSPVTMFFFDQINILQRFCWNDLIHIDHILHINQKFKNQSSNILYHSIDQTKIELRICQKPAEGDPLLQKFIHHIHPSSIIHGPTFPSHPLKGPKLKSWVNIFTAESLDQEWNTLKNSY